MERLIENKIIIISRKTRLENLIVRYNTIEQAKFYIESMGSDFTDYLNEDYMYKQSLQKVIEISEGFARVQLVERDFLPNFIFGKDDIVIAVGQDGLVANTLKYLENQALIGVNPDPIRWDGVLLPFDPEDLKQIIPEVIQGGRPIKEVTLVKVELNDGQVLLGVNDLFIGQKTHVSARYEIGIGAKKEQQSSSGIIISTGLGASGWLKSIVAGAREVVSNYHGVKDIGENDGEEFLWNSDYLYYTVREPFPSNYTSANLVFGKITKYKPLKITSQMPENGVIFSDGIESDYLIFNSGTKASIGIAKQKGQIIV